MPFKHNATRRHRIPKMKYKVTNWPDYEAGLRRRGSLTLWLTPEALAAWRAPRRKTRGGQPRYSDLAIDTVLTLGCVFGLRLRQSEGLMLSLLDLMHLDLPVPDHTTLSRRAQRWAPRPWCMDVLQVIWAVEFQLLRELACRSSSISHIVTGFRKRSTG